MNGIQEVSGSIPLISTNLKSCISVETEMQLFCLLVAKKTPSYARGKGELIARKKVDK